MSDDSNQHGSGDEDSNETGRMALPRVPLHPRKAQELFFELLQTTVPSSQPSDTDFRSQSLQQRIAGMQTEYEAALKQLKRGMWVQVCASVLEPTVDSQLIQLRLSTDGSKLQLSQFVSVKSQAEEREADDADGELEMLEEVPLTAIASIEILPNADCFALHSAGASSSAVSCSLFEAESETVLKQCALAISGSVHAIKTQVDTGRKTEQLLWQAIRLRIVELSSSSSLRDAIATLATAYERIQLRETEIELPDHAALFVLRCS